MPMGFLPIMNIDLTSVVWPLHLLGKGDFIFSSNIAVDRRFVLDIQLQDIQDRIFWAGSVE